MDVECPGTVGFMSDAYRFDAPGSSAERPVSPLSAGELNEDLREVARTLHQEYDVRLGADFVTQEIGLVAGRFTNAKIRSFVPLLVRRYVVVELREGRASAHSTA